PPPPPPNFQPDAAKPDELVGLVGSEMCIRDRIRAERVSTSDQLALKFCACLFPDYKLPFDFKR
ncbi:hypothetical protein ACN6QF_18330, partial [Acinetobacter baumannii]